MAAVGEISVTVPPSFDLAAPLLESALAGLVAVVELLAAAGANVVVVAATDSGSFLNDKFVWPILGYNIGSGVFDKV